jgi:VIT1/CCC1 family predicted Fe2+/Mn2+ transporter
MAQPEKHRGGRTGWLRAAVLGANDGIVSTASLVIGVAAAEANQTAILVAGVAGLAAGALSMAAGEYVSVSSQADTERADLEIERRQHSRDSEAEVQELAGIYVKRGVEPALAQTVAQQLMLHDALGAHARDELGISDHIATRPLQAALASATAFAAGAAVPLLTIQMAPQRGHSVFVACASLACLAALGALAARTGGASPGKGAIRVAFWGALAMTVTAGVGWIFGTVV